MNTGYLNYTWYAYKDDRGVSGWCVMPQPEPPSLGIQPVCDGANRECAEHIAATHNASLETPMLSLGETR